MSKPRDDRPGRAGSVRSAVIAGRSEQRRRIAAPEWQADDLAISGQNVLGDLRLRELLATVRTLLGQATRRPAAVLRESAALLGELRKIVAGSREWEVAPEDKRFTDPAWTDSAVYRTLLQGYLAWSQSLQDYPSAAGLDAAKSRRARFLLGQVSAALAPTNFLPGNPTALRQARDSRGRSLLAGCRNLVKDVAARRPIPSQVDRRAFTVGENLACTPGDVVLRTEMFELLQYKPQTETVRQRPILVVPSIINKYYAFDLAPERSLFEHLVRSGFTVFTMAFRNPGREHDHWGMDAYMDAMDTAIDAVGAIGGVDDPHLWVVCGSAPLVVSLAGHYQALGRKKIGSLTLFVAPLDMSRLADTNGLGDFLNLKNTAATRVGPRKSDRVSARELALLFAMLRPNDLIWNYWVNNYLLGEDPPVFDILAWNDDGTGMTGQFNREFHDFTQANPLLESGAMTVKGTPIADIGGFGFDSYVIGARTDHICPWEIVYRSAELLGERCEFVLGGSGHIQTIVSPPGSAKAHYFAGGRREGSAADWLESAERVQGTWWDHFAAWCHERSGRYVPASATAGSAAYPSLGPAPGTYVFETVP